MAYKIKDLQFDYRYFSDGVVFETKADVLEQLASYHSIDFDEQKDNGEYYEDIWEFLDTFEDEEAKLQWILDYGQWELEEVGEYEKIHKIIDNFIIYYTFDEEKREELRQVLDDYLELGEPYY